MPLPSLSSPAAAPPEAGERLARWERLTRQAREAHGRGRLESALAAQVQALWLAEELLDGPLLMQRPDDCLAALVVSHHNLADLYCHRGQAGQAIDHLCQAHALLLRLGSDAHVPPDVRQAAWRHLREARAGLLAWQRERGSEPAIEAALHLPDLAVQAGRFLQHLH
ncbi:MAG: hypothetical protein QM586_05865 [Xenophilus sp.]